jgi:hypothetical protein
MRDNFTYLFRQDALHKVCVHVAIPRPHIGAVPHGEVTRVLGLRNRTGVQAVQHTQAAHEASNPSLQTKQTSQA